jgi:hypothetical protein
MGKIFKNPIYGKKFLVNAMYKAHNLAITKQITQFLKGENDFNRHFHEGRYKKISKGPTGICKNAQRH